MSQDTTHPVLELRNIEAGYNETVVLRDVSLVVPVGSVVALLGANGVGKTTLLRVASGFLRPRKGAVLLGGVEVTGVSPYSLARRGVCLVPEGRGIFRSLTVQENLAMFGSRRNNEELEKVFSMFGVLRSRLKQEAGMLSGGEQQMLALARTFLSKPDIVLLDEVSMGLAPKMIDTIFEALRSLIASGVSVVIVEQYIARALELADLAYLLSQDGVDYSGPATDLDREQVVKRYLHS